MPSAPKSFRIEERKKEREEIRGNCVERGYDWHWMKISRMVRQQYPVCQVCNDAASEDVDHIIPFKSVDDPLRTQISNCRAICRKCHNAKTARQNR
jgi:5-methylcytosine-specific restriction endonuclease McrA